MWLEGWHLIIIIIIIVLALVLFAAPKLPGTARSLGQSTRIFKSEIRELKKYGGPDTMDWTGPVEGRDVNHPQAGATESRTGGLRVLRPGPGQPGLDLPALGVHRSRAA